jgi:hypothetical protein
VLRSAESSSTFENAGLLCEAIGKIGGPTAFDALARFALQESRSSEYSLVRKGAVRGLAHLRDPRAAAVLAEVSQRYGFDSLVFDAHRAVGLEMPQPPRPASIPAWVEDAQTWDRIAEAFISSQVATKAPDFKGFAEMVAPYDGKRRHGAWHSVAFAFLKSGDRRTASQCFVEALLQDTDPDLSSTAWRKIELPQEGPELSDLRGRLAVAAERLSGSRELARELRELLGPPGSGGSVKEGGAQ